MWQRYCIAVLAGFGFDSFTKQLEKRNIKNILPAFLAIGGILLISWTISHLGLDPAQKSVAQRNLLLPTLLFGGFLGISTLLLFIQNKKLSVIFLILVLSMVSFDSLRFAQKWMPFDPRQFVFPQVPIVDAMKKNIGTGRVYGNIGAQVESFYGLPGVGGYDPLYIGRYGEFIQASQEGTPKNPERSVVKLGQHNRYTDKVLDLLGATVIFHPKADTNTTWAYPVWKDTNRHSILYSDDKFQLFKNNNALSRAALFFEYDIISNKNEILKRFYNENFDIRKKLILEEDPMIPQKENNPVGKADILSYKENEVVIRTNASDPALLFLSDNYYPGWNVEVDGKPENIYRANYSFRAVKVPQGEHTIVFSYDPLSFRFGVYAALVGLAGLAVLIVLKKQLFPKPKLF